MIWETRGGRNEVLEPAENHLDGFLAAPASSTIGQMRKALFPTSTDGTGNDANFGPREF
jgi:hypothetical protein